MPRRPRITQKAQDDIDQQIRDVSKLVQATLGEISASDLKGGRPGKPLKFNCKGSFGTFGTATGCLGTFGTFGCGQIQVSE